MLWARGTERNPENPEEVLQPLFLRATHFFRLWANRARPGLRVLFELNSQIQKLEYWGLQNEYSLSPFPNSTSRVLGVIPMVNVTLFVLHLS